MLSIRNAKIGSFLHGVRKKCTSTRFRILLCVLAAISAIPLVTFLGLCVVCLVATILLSLPFLLVPLCVSFNTTLVVYVLWRAVVYWKPTLISKKNQFTSYCTRRTSESFSLFPDYTNLSRWTPDIPTTTNVPDYYNMEIASMEKKSGNSGSGKKKLGERPTLPRFQTVEGQLHKQTTDKKRTWQGADENSLITGSCSSRKNNRRQQSENTRVMLDKMEEMHHLLSNMRRRHRRPTIVQKHYR